jgi:putative colanic acid biosynthesis glycosyltransferase WcaI
MGPIATLWARRMTERGHEISVVTAYPHYPRAFWGQRVRPRRELRDGITVLRLPLWIGHDSARARIREEVTYAIAVTGAVAMLPPPDVYVVVSPSFAALAPLSAAGRVTRRPWVLWLQDILPEAALTTGLVRDSGVIRAATRFERLAYRSADRIVVISETFRTNLLGKGVAASKIEVIYNPAVRGSSSPSRVAQRSRTILAMGNIGLSQGLAEHVEAFEASDLDARFVIVGTGEAADSVRRAVRSSRVEMRGLVDDVELERELGHATVGLVTQRSDVTEFNVPSRLMTFMARGIPVVASVRDTSEVARILEKSRGGWVTNLPALDETLHTVLGDAAELDRRGEAARRYADRWFEPTSMCVRFEEVLDSVSRRRPANG